MKETAREIDVCVRSYRGKKLSVQLKVILNHFFAKKSKDLWSNSNF